MKKLLFIVTALPLMVIAQNTTKSKDASPAKKPGTAEVKRGDGFIIDGEVTGFPEGTSVALVNVQTGAPESESVISNNKFILKGKMAEPDFKVVLFNKQQPYITLFLDNSSVKIVGNRDDIQNASITGSPSQNDFQSFNATFFPFRNLYDENAVVDSATAANALQAINSFIQQHPASFITPLAIIRYFQLSEDPIKLESMYNGLAAPVKTSAMGNYIVTQIADAKRNAIGSVLPDFTLADTTGKMVSLSSLRGKYVLVDFWASWCRPCRQENPNVVANYNKFKDKNFTILGVSLDKEKPSWINAINSDGLTWSHVIDYQDWTKSVSQKFEIATIPQNILVGPDGKIVAKNLRGPKLERKLTAILK